VRGYYPSMSQARGDYSIPLPLKYYEESFKILSEAGMNHIRYRFYWEAYVKDPFSFINELVTIAQTADRFGIKVLYDNHQYHTSSWLDPQRGTGFPSFLFENNNSSYPFGSGGDTEFTSAQKWWTNWWNRSITDTNGNDGWILQAEFLKKVVNAVDNNTSTLGYEILNEPQVHHKDQWDKVGKYNTFITDKLREITQRTIAYDMNIPVDLDDDDDSQIDMTPENLAKMAPSNNKTNIIFKFSVYGIPEANTYQEDRLDIFVKAAKLADVPIYVGEWNNLSRERVVNEEGKIVFQTIPELSDINQIEANFIVQKLKEIDVWGMAY
jgi:Cellulase (glycosyl hydrolase family 5)